MKKGILLAFLLMIASAIAGAQTLTPAELQDRVQIFAAQLHHTQQLPQVEAVKLDGCDGIAAYNIEGGGFVVACADTRVRTILGYSRQGSIDPADMPPAFRFWLGEYADQLRQLGDITLKELQENYHPAKTVLTYPDTVAYMLTSTWGQSRMGYNSQCPTDNTLVNDGNHPSAGCVAVAIGQIMRYWQFPSHGHFCNSYSHSLSYRYWRYGTLSVCFDTATYDYSLMPDALTTTSTAAQVNAVAQLLYHCGVASNMRYNNDGNGSSGTSDAFALQALTRHFYYDTNARFLDKNHYSSAWVDMLKGELAGGRPILYCGVSIENQHLGILGGGHAFVFDGYDSADCFHVNWGWNGQSDGFFAVDVLYPRTDYYFSNEHSAIFGLQPDTNYSPLPVITMASDMSMGNGSFQIADSLRGSYRLTNIGDTVGGIYVGVNVYDGFDENYIGCVDGRRVSIAPGDTQTIHFAQVLPGLSIRGYRARLVYSNTPIAVGSSSEQGSRWDNPVYRDKSVFFVVDSNNTHLSNLVIFIKFAGDDEIDQPFATFDHMFNDSTEGAESVYNFFKATTYGKIHFKSVYDLGATVGYFRSYTDIHPRGYYQPYSETNPEGYRDEVPLVGIHPRERELIARAIQTYDVIKLVNENTLLDGNGDGDIDNVSFIVKGGVDSWASMLWPHMEFFPHDSIDGTLTLNGKRVNAFNFEFEGAGSQHFNTRVFCHEMGHSLRLPDLYHYVKHTATYPVYTYDIMSAGNCHQSVIYKNRILKCCDDPIQITQPGTYTINSNGSSPSQNLYYIKSAIDTNQWYTIEYRCATDPWETSIPDDGLLMGRWLDTANITDMQGCGNAWFDYSTHYNTYSLFFPGSSCDTVQGHAEDALFSNAVGRGTFGPWSNPHTFLADGTRETLFEIYDIQPNGQQCTFHVRFVSDGIAEAADGGSLVLYPNPAVEQVTLALPADQAVSVSLYDLHGRELLRQTLQGRATLSLQGVPAGIYMLRAGTQIEKLIVK